MRNAMKKFKSRMDKLPYPWFLLSDEEIQMVYNNPFLFELVYSKMKCD